MGTVTAAINPDWILWTRERLGLDVESFSDRMKVKPSLVEAWENGSRGISLNHLAKMASLVLQPLGMFFLPDVPASLQESAAFRTVGGLQVSEPSPELESTILSMRERQLWYRDYLIENGLEGPSALGSVKVTASPRSAANALRSFLGCEAGFAKKFRDFEAYLAGLVGLLERAGILCVRSGVVGNNTSRPLDVEEFRGFALYDEYAPLIFVNARDSRSAQLFTLIHETVHLLLGQNSIVTKELLVPSQRDREERFCNAVAAEFLVPENELKPFWRSDLDDEEQMSAVASRFKVSRLVAIARCRDLGLLSSDAAGKLWAKEQATISRIKKRGGGGDYYKTLKSHIGVPFGRAILNGLADSSVSFTDAFRLLGVKNVKQLEKLRDVLDDAIST